ncbi:MAG: hypothetical protein WCW26_04915 [Candidatus Buchananbacteria bacterium]
MSKRNRIIVIIASAVIFLLILILLFWFLNQRKQIKTGAVVNTDQQQVLPSTPASTAGLNKSPESPVKEKNVEANIKAVATTFAERFGSYSSEGNYSNLSALKDLMTVRMKAWVQNYQAAQPAPSTDFSPYYGVTTQALSATISNYDQATGRAQVDVSTQRQEYKVNTSNPRVYYQILKLELAQTAAGWKVDTAEWQK